MAINAKLEMRQTQSLVMTPQLQQAIKLLQLSNVELSTFVEGELERNPLLERAEGDGPVNPSADDQDAEGADAKGEGAAESREADNWVDLESGGDNTRTEDLDADPKDMFPDSEDFVPGAVTDSGWTGLAQSGPSVSEDGTDLEAYVAEEKTLRAHLSEQLSLAFSDPAQRMIGGHIIDLTDEAGYLRGDLASLAAQLGAPLSLVEETLREMQTFDPCGVFARDLRECLTLQLKEQDRCDPAMAALIDNLHLLATHDFVALKRATGVTDEDLVDMVAEVKRLNPKPGLEFGATPAQPIVPDVLLRALPDGSYHVELNSDTLPRVLVNQTYYAKVTKSPLAKDDKSYLVDCLQTANWLVKSLDQRARTILKVSQEIVRQQDAFFTYGVRHLRPLNLKTVADAISMHESTVSRVTANKYMATNRGLFELKYFFTSAIAATGEGDFHSSEAVRHRIREMIDAEPAEDVLSDDKIVERLKTDGIDIARRTVAKYREALGIPSSVQRRRQKRIAMAASA
ncbi:RNA polymerase sigma-54 factor [Methyloceanibacter methanicus]|uniref:RNA polymerase sigma-54 factor n=1 Tax=Methyloceanibacter methanicus TaxID=1774968 RepID=A0A1E3W1Y1_9HYPH|nr:RNA polymerase factor sigma-54 [Methyloceanibacter methanicus]ODR99814.1 RNA polymerase sigma-54 factor [Methyloceanibacter methanicus]